MTIIADQPFREAAQSTAVDLSTLTVDQAAALRFHVLEFRQAQLRICRDLFVMTKSLHDMSNLLGAQFPRFATQELGLNPRTARRYLQIYSVLSAHFTTENGLFAADEASRVSQNALLLLTDDPADEVIAEIRQIAQSGERVDEATVKKLIEERNGDAEARAVVAEARAKQLEEASVAAANQAELEQARLKNQLAKSEEGLRRISDQRTALEEEVEQLRAQATQVVEKIVEKEVTPKGYASISEATEAAEQKLNQKIKELEQAEADLRDGQAKVAALRANVATASAGAEVFNRLKEQVETIMLKFPVAMLKTTSEADPQIKTSIHALGEAMVAMGKLLKDA